MTFPTAVTARLSLALACAGPLAGMSVASAGSAVPPEFRAACGRPGSDVRATRALLGPIRVRHADCDLRGVFVHGVSAGVEVPSRPGGNSATGTSPLAEEEIAAVVERTTLNVTITLSVSAKR